MPFSVPAQSSRITRHRAAILQFSWAVKTASSSEYQEAYGRKNRGIGYKLVSRSVKSFLRTRFSETTLDGQVRRSRLEVCHLHFPPRRGHLICIPGSIKLCPYVVPKKAPRYRPSKPWRESMASGASNASRFCEDPEKLWFEVKHSVSMKSDDQCRVGSWVFAMIRATGATCSGPSVDTPAAVNTTICGRIVELLAPAEHSTEGVAVIEVYQMLEGRHPIFGMPCLTKAAVGGKSLVAVSTKVWLSLCFVLAERGSDLPQNVEFDFNVQHDCGFAGCSATGKRPRRQERIISDDVLDDAIEHRDVDQWIINAHSLHNGHLLRLRVRPELISPVRMIPAEERQKRHHEAASGLRPKQDKKRKNIADKRAAKKASEAVDSEEGSQATGPQSVTDGAEPMDIDVGAVPAL